VGDPFHKPAEFIYWSDVVGFDQLIDHTAALDPATFQVTLKEASGPFLLDLALFPFAIVSPTALQSSVEDLSQNPVGTGPFKFVEWVRGDHITLDAYSEYWDKTRGPSVSHLTIKGISDPSSLAIAVQSGGAQFAGPLNAPQAQHGFFRVPRIIAEES